LGLTIVRGNEVVSITIEGPPPADTVRSKTQSALGGSNIQQMTNIGIAALSSNPIPIGITGLVKGLGGPAPGTMLPSPLISNITQTYHGARPLPGVLTSGNLRKDLTFILKCSQNKFSFSDSNFNCLLNI